MANSNPTGSSSPPLRDEQQRSAGRHSLPVKCAACDRPLDLPLVCTECHQLHPTEGLDHFSLFGIPRQYDVDPALLRRQFLRLSREIHPDRLISCASDPEIALRLSAQANHAYEVLSSPILRAGYLLELARGRSATEDKSAPQALLQETLVLREEIDEALAEGNESALLGLRSRIHERKSALEHQITDLASQLPGTERTRNALRATLNALKYIGRLLEAAHPGAQA